MKYTKIAKLDCDAAYHAAFEEIEKVFGRKVGQSACEMLALSFERC